MDSPTPQRTTRFTDVLPRDNELEVGVKIGQGTYGKIYEARISSLSKKLVVKVPRHSSKQGVPRSTLREISFLREFEHENIVKCLGVRTDVVVSTPILVFERAWFDLGHLISSYRKEGILLSNSTIHSVIHQILRGVDYLHSRGVMHRDLKPGNVLVEDGRVKITDFGMARCFVDPALPFFKDGPVCSLWYRAPELLVGCREYTHAIDLWAIGCIWGELLQGEALFSSKHVTDATEMHVNWQDYFETWQGSFNADGSAEIWEVRRDVFDGMFEKNHAEKVVSILGKPSRQDWQALPNATFRVEMERLTVLPKRSLSQIYNQRQRNDMFNGLKAQDGEEVGSDALVLIENLLTYNPLKRWTTRDVLKMKYWDDVLIDCFEFDECLIPNLNILR